MDRRFGSDDMEVERHQDRIDADREEHGWKCEYCGRVGMTEDEAMYHECVDAEEFIEEEDRRAAEMSDKIAEMQPPLSDE